MLYVYQMMETRSFGKSLRNPMSFWPTEMSRTILFALVSIVSSHIRCNFTNFARNICCLKCKAEGPKKSGESDIEMKKGNWNCPKNMLPLDGVVLQNSVGQFFSKMLKKLSKQLHGKDWNLNNLNTLYMLGNRVYIWI
ncbi:uncharacterized protein LOC133797950 isoform X3 [Humulus lupulus]|uniref:uncharacterized protein LOC133797950 isoform X3 n=1 Tax=Humulus lupulus TaxID=3486 RepID=UPI002B4139EA|nr:uncharacterized protein LOC133797950 isoform X3 [Humulus lupulus]